MHSFQDGIFSWLTLLAAQSAKASLLAGLVALLCLLPRRWLSPPWRHLLWCAVFLRLVLPDVPVPGWSWNINRLLPEAEISRAAPTPAPVDEALASVPALQAEEPFIPLTSSPSLQVIPTTPLLQSPPLSWQSMLGMLWLGGTLTWWCALGVGAWRFRRRMTHASEAAPRTQALLKACLAEANLRTPIQVKCPRHLAVPAVCGVLLPVILIPRTIEAALSQGDLRLLLLHELGHVRRRDTAVQVTASLLLGLHWWNPVLWFAWSRLRHESEAATDAWVLRHSDPDSAPAYGAMLLDLAARACAVGLSFLLLPGLMSATSHGKRLRQRLVAITGFRRLHRRAAWCGCAAIAVLALTGFSQNASTPASSSEQKADVTSIGGIVVDEQGKPIPGAKVEINFSRPKDTLTKSALPQGPLKPEFTESDAQGHWHFDGVPSAVLPETLQDAVGRDTYRLYVTHPDFLVSEFSGAGTTLGGDASFREQSAKLVLARGHVIRGVVRDQKGHAIAGATIERNVNVRHGADPKATTDANGNYVLKAARPGNFVVRVRADGFALQQQRVILTADENLDFTMKPAHTLTLKLRDPKGQPLTKGYVNLMPVIKPWQDSDRLWVGKPDQDGAVIWKEAPGGDVIAVVHMDGCERLDQTVPTDQETVITPKATPPLPMLTLRVKSADTGKPLSGCTFDTGLIIQGNRNYPLWMRDSIHAPLEATTTEGEYQARIPKFSWDPMIFHVRCPGYAPATTTPMDPKKGDSVTELSLKEHASLTLTVRGTDDKPAAKTHIYVAWGNDRTPWRGTEFHNDPHLFTDFTLPPHRLEFQGQTDDDGHCVLPACADEATVLVTNDSGCAISDYGRLVKDSTLKLHALHKGEDEPLKMLMKLILLKPASDPRVHTRIHVRLMREGKPVLGKDRFLTLRTDDQSALFAISVPVQVDQGVASLDGKPGMNALQIATQTADGNYWFTPLLTTEVKPGESAELSAVLEPGLRITGRLADEVPRPVKNKLICAFVGTSDQYPSNKIAWSDRRPVREDGAFEFPSLPPGDMQFVVLADGWNSPLAPGNDGKNHPWSAGRISHSRSDVVVPMQRNVSCEVTVVDDTQGKAVPGASVRMSAFFTPHGGRQELIFFDGEHSALFFPPNSIEETFALKTHLPGDEISHFKIITDDQGRVTLHGLPPLAALNQINVVAPGLDPLQVHKPSATATVSPIKPGETAKVTVKLGKEEEK